MTTDSMPVKRTTLAGWGNYPRLESGLVNPRYIDELPRMLKSAETLIARGNGRSYGDAAVNPDLTVAMGGMNRIRAFDRQTGRITCEAGVLLADLLEVITPHGWFMPVVPGTAEVSLGGMAAADIHGKNHHIDGAFGRHVESLKMLLGDGQVIDCSVHQHPDLFAATLGGMGLTGIILELTVRLVAVESAWVRQTTREARNLDEIMEMFESGNKKPLSVAWLDCLAGRRALGRSLMFTGQIAQPDQLPKRFRERPYAIPVRRKKLTVPGWVPGGLLNRFSVSGFNRLYYRWHAASRQSRILPYPAYHFPLDGLAGWNRLYGRRGLIQHQSVLPTEASRQGLGEILGRTHRAGHGSMLAVLKKFGPGAGPLSFPMPGYTLALDFPMRADTVKLARELEAIVRDHGGRLYLAKDAVSEPQTLRSGYPELDAFERVRVACQGQCFQSSLSRRLEMT